MLYVYNPGESFSEKMGKCLCTVKVNMSLSNGE